MDNNLNIAFEKPIITEFYRGYTILDKIQNERHFYILAVVYDSQSTFSLNLFKIDLFDSNLELKRQVINLNGSKLYKGKFISIEGDFIIIQVEGQIEETHGVFLNEQIRYLTYNITNGTIISSELPTGELNDTNRGIDFELDPNIMTLLNEKYIENNLIANCSKEGFGILILNVNHTELVTLPPFNYRNDRVAQSIIISRYKKSQIPLMVIKSFSGDGTMVVGDQVNLYKSENQKSITIQYKAFNLPNEIANIKVCLSPDSSFKKIIRTNILSLDQHSICFELLNKTTEGSYLLRLENNKILSSSIPVQIKNDYYDDYVKTKKITWANAILLVGLLFIIIWLALITFMPSLIGYKFNIFNYLLSNQDYNTLWQWVISLIVLTPLLGAMSFILKYINQCLKFING